MDYIRTKEDGQLVISRFTEFLHIPSALYGFHNKEAARALKKTRYILMSNRSTLQKKDEDAASERVIHKGSGLFKTADYSARPDMKLNMMLCSRRMNSFLPLI